ncbi:MAG: MATE family efflux transporter [Clostridia bacterium]|nr:MATE family efflux transporter [Clostridia bacterium]
MEKTKDKKELLGTAPIPGLLFRLALPTVAAQLINMLYNIVDRIYIGHIAEVGDLALTGVGVCMPLIMLVSAFAALVGSGGAPRASIFMGKGDMKSAERTLGGCFGLQIIVSLILTVVLCIWNRDLLLAFGASENTIAYAAEYMSIYAMGTIFVQLTLGMNAFISAQGFTSVAMLSVMVGAVANIVLDPILIYGLQMGVGGAAVATILSQALSCVWVIVFLCGKRTMLRLKPYNMIPTPTVVLPCVALGSATFIMQASESVISVCFNSSLLAYGGDIAVGAMTILTSVMQFAMLPMQGIAQGAQPILSYNYGAKNATRVVKTFRLLLISCLIYSFTLGTCVMLFPRAFAAMFTTDAALLDFTERVIRIYFGGIFFFGIQIACQMTFVSMGKALSSVTVAIVRKFVLLLPLIYLLPHLCDDSTLGVYLAEPIADIAAVTFTAILFFVQFRRAKRELTDVDVGRDPTNPESVSNN